VIWYSLAGLTYAGAPSRRLRFDDLLESLWRRRAVPRLIFPDDFKLKRFLAPEWVFILATVFS
jgi:hypothetical protein